MEHRLSPIPNHQPRFTAAQRRPGFTLTELLVVIAIIAVLASLVSVGVMRALDTAKQTGIKTELDMIDTALRAYKDKYGEFPPCDLRPSNDAAIRRHVARAFPRYYDITQAPADIRNYMGADDFRPDQALVFWLGGFNGDPQRPFDSLNTLKKAQRKDMLFDFDEARLINISTLPVGPTTFGGGACPSYLPKGLKINAPYVYFDAGMYMMPDLASSMNPKPQKYLNSPFPSWQPQRVPEAGMAMAYFNDANGNGVADHTKLNGVTPDENYANPDSYQLIAAGIDGKYGAPMSVNTRRIFPTGMGYAADGTEEDNVTNLSTKVRLGDARP